MWYTVLAKEKAPVRDEHKSISFKREWKIKCFPWSNSPGFRVYSKSYARGPDWKLLPQKGLWIPVYTVQLNILPSGEAVNWQDQVITFILPFSLPVNINWTLTSMNKKQPFWKRRHLVSNNFFLHDF